MTFPKLDYSFQSVELKTSFKLNNEFNFYSHPWGNIWKPYYHLVIELSLINDEILKVASHKSSKWIKRRSKPLFWGSFALLGIFLKRTGLVSINPFVVLIVGYVLPPCFQFRKIFDKLSGFPYKRENKIVIEKKFQINISYLGVRSAVRLINIFKDFLIIYNAQFW